MVDLEQIFCEMEQISHNGGVYMAVITSDMIKFKNTSQLLLTILILNYRTSFARIRPEQI